MPYPMTRLRVRVGGNEFNSHFFIFTPCPVLWMAQGSPGAVHNRLVRCIAAAMRFIYFDVKIGLSNKFWARHLAETVAICRSATAHHLSGWRVANPETAANLVRYSRNGQGGLNASGIIAGVWKQTAFSGSYGVETENATAFRQWRSWLRGVDLNHRPLGYEPNELPDCSTPHFDHSQGHLHRQTEEITITTVWVAQRFRAAIKIARAMTASAAARKGWPETSLA